MLIDTASETEESGIGKENRKKKIHSTQNPYNQKCPLKFLSANEKKLPCILRSCFSYFLSAVNNVFFVLEIIVLNYLAFTF